MKHNRRTGRSNAQTISMTMPDGRQVVTDMPPAFVMDAVRRACNAMRDGRAPDSEDASVAIRFIEEQERKYPTSRPAKGGAGDDPSRARVTRAHTRLPDGTTYPLLPLDMARVLRPGTLSQFLQLEDTDPAEALMVEIPLDDFIEARESLAEVVRELGRSLLVILLVDEDKPA